MAGGKKSKGKKPPGNRKPSSDKARSQEGPGKQSRAERLEQLRRARRRKALRIRVISAAVVAALLALVVGKVLADRRAEQAQRERLTAGSCTFDTRSDDLSQPPNNHVPPEGYEVDPPAGGNHAPQAAPAGFYGEGGQPPPSDPELVHSLEHGYVVLWHRPGIEAGDLDAIRAVYDRYSRDVLVVPRPSLDVEVAATAWGKRLLCPQTERSSLQEFVRLYRNKGPEKVEHP